MAVGALAYRDHYAPVGVWWQWLVELGASWALLIVAAGEGNTSGEAAWRRGLRWASGAAAVACGAQGAALMSQPGRELAAGLWIVGAIGAFLASRWLPLCAADFRHVLGPTVPVAPGTVPVLAARAALVSLSVALVFAAVLVNPEHHFAGFALWVGALVVFPLAFLQRSPAGNEVSPDRGADFGPEVSGTTVALLLALIFCLALALRVPLLGENPFTINPDEGRLGRYAEGMWRNGFADAFDVGWNVFPNLSYMAMYLPVQLLGMSNANLRLSSAVIGTLSLLPLYFWVRRWWGSFVALVAVLVLAINREHVLWSRLGLNNIHQVLVASLMLLTFARALQTRRNQDWVWFGYATGLAFYVYHAAKIFPVLLVPVVVLLATGVRGFVRGHVRAVAVALLAFLVICAPLGVAMHRRWNQFYGGTSNRFDVQQLFDASERGDLAAVRGYLSSHVSGCLFSLFSRARTDVATFDPVTGTVFLVAVGWVLWRWRDPRHLVLITWTAGILVVGGMITDYPPAKTRMLGFLPVVAVLPALMAGLARRWLYRLFPARGDLLGVPLVLAWAVPALALTWHDLFVLGARKYRGDQMSEICRSVESVRLPATVYMAGGGCDAESELRIAMHDCMVADDPGRRLVNLSEDALVVPIPPDNAGNAVILVDHAQQYGLVPLIRHYHPDAFDDLRTQREGWSVLHVFSLSDTAVERMRGLRATFLDGGGTRTTLAGDSRFAAPANAVFPVTAVWRGIVWIDRPGARSFRSVGGAPRVDGKPVASDRPVELAAGWHAVELTAELRDRGSRASLEWRLPEWPDWQEIPRSFLHTHPDAHGLLGRYFAGGIEGAGAQPIPTTPQYARLDGALSFDWIYAYDQRPQALLADGSSTMEWSGSVVLPEGGGQAFRVEASGPVQVFLDGASVASIAKGAAAQRAVDVELGERTGRVPILVRTVRSAAEAQGCWKFRLLWRGPAGDWSVFADYRPD